MNKLDANSMGFFTQLIDLEYYQTPYDQSKGRKGAVLGKNCNYSIKKNKQKTSSLSISKFLYWNNVLQRKQTICLSPLSINARKESVMPAISRFESTRVTNIVIPKRIIIFELFFIYGYTS